jgi:hypothetical protein
MDGIASGMGATYTDTSGSVGALRNCKKGDGLVEMAVAGASDLSARIVVECTTGITRRNWTGYLDEAERNRQAQASIGIVAHRGAVPGGELVALLGPTRAVLAFDPDVDDPAVLRAVVQLLGLQAQRRLAEGRGGDLGEVDAHLVDARRVLSGMQDMVKTATSVRADASKLVGGLEAMSSTLGRLLDQAQAALKAAAAPGAAVA